MFRLGWECGRNIDVGAPHSENKENVERELQKVLDKYGVERRDNERRGNVNGS